MERLLKTANAQVERAFTVESAAVAMAGEQFDLVISELEVGGESGLDVLHQAVRAQPHARHCLLTGDDEANGLLKRAGLHGVLLIDKPWNNDEVLSALGLVR